MAGPQHGIMGDENYGTDLPQTVLKDELATEKRMSKFSKTKEFQVLKAHAEARIAFYQTQLPDGRPLTGVDLQERAQHWVIANAVIGEFNALLTAYENAAETVKNVR